MYASAGLILAIDWNAVTGLIISGGEDCKYKVELLGHDPSIFFPYPLAITSRTMPMVPGLGRVWAAAVQQRRAR